MMQQLRDLGVGEGGGRSREAGGWRNGVGTTSSAVLSVVFASAFIQDAVLGEEGGRRHSSRQRKGKVCGGLIIIMRRRRRRKGLWRRRRKFFDGRGGGDLEQSLLIWRPLVSGIAK